MDREQIKQVLEQVDKVLPPKDCVTFTLSKEPTTVFDNKIGGIPYFPKDMEYPTFENKPLVLLAQLNFNTFKSIPNFPDKGIMQIYIADDDCYGIDWNDNTSNTSFRVIYHEDIITDTDKLIDTLPYELNDYMLFTEEYKLIPNEPSVMYATPYVEGFDDIFTKTYNELFDEPIKDIFQLDNELLDSLYERNERTFIWIGGYPVFTQEDPRRDDEYSILLFESDSYTKDDIYIMWGDSGTGTFFIKPDDLINKNFSKTMFSWDCC